MGDPSSPFVPFKMNFTSSTGTFDDMIPRKPKFVSCSESFDVSHAIICRHFSCHEQLLPKQITYINVSSFPGKFKALLLRRLREGLRAVGFRFASHRNDTDVVSIRPKRNRNNLYWCIRLPLTCYSHMGYTLGSSKTVRRRNR